MTVSGVGLLSRARCVTSRGVWVALVASGVNFGALRAARAEQTPTVDVPGECGSRVAFLDEVKALQRTATARFTVSEVTIVRRDAGTYELRLVSPEGSRVVVDADCRTLFKTAAVIAATLAEPTAAATSIAPPTATEPGASAGAVDATPSLPQAVALAPLEPKAVPAEAAPTARRSSAERSTAEQAPKTPPAPVRAATPAVTTEPPSVGDSTAMQLGAGAAGFAGLSPDPHLGLEVLAGLTGKRWGGHVAARLLPPRSMLVRNRLGLRETVWGGRLSASHLVAPWLRVSLGMSGYWFSAQGVGISEPSTDGVGLLAPELEVVAAVLARPAFRAEMGLQGRVGLTQPRFEVEAGQVVYELPRLGGAAVLRILWTQQ